MTPLAIRARLRDQESQQTFDAFMRTLAEPGTIRHLPEAILDDRIAVAAWLPLALADVDVNVSIDDDPNGTSAHLIRLATGARLVSLELADVAAFSSIEVHQIERIPIGTALDPERGAKVAIRVDAVTLDATSCSLTIALEGPGVPGKRLLGVDGLSANVASRLGTASGPFPAGFDTWLIGNDGAVAGISRSTTVSVSATTQPHDRRAA